MLVTNVGIERTMLMVSLNDVESVCPDCGCTTVTITPGTGYSSLSCSICGRTTYHSFNMEHLRNCLLTNQNYDV